MEQEFKISKERKRIYLIFGAIMFLLFSFTFYYGIQIWQDPSSSSFRKYVVYPCFIIYIFSSMIFYIYNGLFMKITINDERIRFRSFGIAIAANWSKLIMIEDHGTRFNKLEGISVQKWNVRKNIFGFLVQHPNHIPVHNFGKNWRDSELGQQIKQYAPHLFENEKSVQSV